MAKQTQIVKSKPLIIAIVAISLFSLVGLVIISTTKGGTTSFKTGLLNFTTDTRQAEKIESLKNELEQVKLALDAANARLVSGIPIDQLPSSFQGRSVNETLQRLADAERAVRRYETDADASVAFLDRYFAARSLRPNGDPAPDIFLQELYRKLATVLAAIGRIDEPSTATGAILSTAIKSLQGEKSLRADGVVGRNTWAMIKQLYEETKSN